MKFVMRKSTAGGRFWFTIVADNGAKLAHSEQYVAKAGALSAIALVQREAADALVVDETPG